MTGNITRLFSVALGYIRKQFNYLKIPIFGKFPKNKRPSYAHPPSRRTLPLLLRQLASFSCFAHTFAPLGYLRQLAGLMMGHRPKDATSPSSTTIHPPSPCTSHQAHSNLPGKPPHTGALHENPGTPYIYSERYNTCLH